MSGDFHSLHSFSLGRQQREVARTSFKTNGRGDSIAVRIWILLPLVLHIVCIPYHVLDELAIACTFPFLEGLEPLSMGLRMKLRDVIMTG